MEMVDGGKSRDKTATPNPLELESRNSTDHMNEDLFLRNKPQLLKEVLLMYLILSCNCLKTTVYNRQTELIMDLSKIK